MAIILAFTNCELTKRRYTHGWRVSGITSKKSVTPIKKNEADYFTLPANETKQTDVYKIKYKEEPYVFSDTIPTKKKGKFRRAIENFDSRTDSITERLKRRLGGPRKDSIRPYNNKHYLLAEYTSFAVATSGFTLFAISLNNFIKYAGVFVLIGLFFLGVSLALGINAQDRIRNERLKYKLWPHKLIINFTRAIFVLIAVIFLALVLFLLL